MGLQNYSEPFRTAKHLSVTPQNSTDCYVSMQSPVSLLGGENQYTVQEKREPVAVISSDGGSNSVDNGKTHQPLRVKASNGNMESSLEFGGAIETSLEFGGRKGISLDYAGSSRLCEGDMSSPRTPGKGENFKTIVEEGVSQLEYGERQTSFTDADTNIN